MAGEQAPRRYPFGQNETIPDRGQGSARQPFQYDQPRQWAGGPRQAPAHAGADEEFVGAPPQGSSYADGGYATAGRGDSPAHWAGQAVPARADQRPAERRSVRRGAAPTSMRTDPSLYEWDRLTPDQQQTVMAAIAGRRGSTSWRLTRTALIYILALAALVMLIGAYLAFRP